VVKVIVISAGLWKAELDAVAPHIVLAREQGDSADCPDRTTGISAAPDAHVDLHLVAGIAPLQRVVGVVEQVLLDGHDDQAVRMVADSVNLAKDPGHVVGQEVDLTVAAGEAACRAGDRCAGVKAPRLDPVDDRNLGAVIDRASQSPIRPCKAER
jgi:hypothetical protein